MVALRVGCLLCCCLLLADRAHAQSGMGVTTQLDPCVPVDAAQFGRLLAIELGTSAGDGRPEAATTRVTVGCVPGGLELQLQDGVTRKSMRRVLPREPIEGPAGTRLLALAVAEFVVASWTELTVTAPQPVEPIGPAPPPALRARARRIVRERIAAAPPSPWLWGVEGGLSGLPGHTHSPLAGGGLRLGYRGDLWWLGLAAEGAYGVEAVDLGRLRLGLIAGRATAGVRVRLGVMALEIGVGGRLGLLLAGGEAVDPARYRGVGAGAPVAAVLLVIGAYYVPDPDLRVGLRATGGLVTWPVELKSDADGIVLNLAGSWVGLALAVDFAL